MKINIISKLESISTSTKDYALEKAKKLEKFYKIRKIEIHLEKEGERYKAEFVISPEKGSTIVGTFVGEDWFLAIDNASDKAERQLRKLKEKVKSHRIKKYVPEQEQETPEEETYEDIVKKLKKDIK